MLVALSAGQTILEQLDERLPSLRVGPAEQLLGFLPGQLEAVQGHPERLAAEHPPEPLAGPADQPAQRPAGRGVGANDGRRRGRALGGTDYLTNLGFAPRTKKGRRPPVRRNASTSGPWAL